MKINSDIEIYQGDCLDILPKLSSKVDLVLTDPPYGVTDCKWDSIIDYNKIWELLHNLSHNTTSYILFGVEPFSTHLRISNIDEYRYDIYWVKNKCTGFLHAKNKPLSNIELISVFSRGYVNHAKVTQNRMTYNPQGLKKIENPKTIKNKNKSKHQPDNEQVYNNSSFQNNEYKPKYTNYPKQVVYFNPVSKKVHVNQKPVALLEYLIKTYTNEGDTVLDFTMGSGSTGVACMNTNRKFIGIELEEEYYNIAENRLKEKNIQTRLV